MLRHSLQFLAVLLLGTSAMAAVNINTAGPSELEALTGIGPSKAKAIVDYRQKNGAFKNVDELDKVPGIGKATVDKFRSEVTVAAGGTKSGTKPSIDKKK
ncbi:helix-hairpin-helix domain-containing protein [Chitinimonas sp. BJYL2]|uniref:ComEA family DNA-binding protein n=1 Tax=Chitinimonas sp. BJYL2 TaxID=2976696 RepID=UPI0022B5AD00|nr:helix-hairpin-helix domain-containing protein [Chitinimonas sp. BJYL2]